MIQYFDFLWKMITLDFGTALTQGERPIRDEMAERFPATHRTDRPGDVDHRDFLVFTAVRMQPSIAKRPQIIYCGCVSIIIYSFPIFFLGLMFQIIFSVRLGWFPLAGRMDPILLANFQVAHQFLHDRFDHYPELAGALVSTLHIWSCQRLTLGLALTGVFVRLTRVNMIEMLQSDFITAGRARGIPGEHAWFTGIPCGIHLSPF